MTRDCSVIVPEAHAVGAVGVIRSLGRAGYRVHAMSAEKNALGFFSNYTSRIAKAPLYESEDFIPWFYEYVKNHFIDAVIPSDGLLFAIRPVYDDFASLITINCSKENLYRCYSKFEVMRSFMTYKGSCAVNGNLPSTLLVEDHTDVYIDDLSDLEKPLFIKVDADPEDLSKPARVYIENDSEKAFRRIKTLVSEYGRLTVQANAKGVDAGVYVLYWDNRVVAEFMNFSNHSVPHTGGFYSLRESFVHNRMKEDAVAKLKHLSWEGPAMMEYRWDPVSDTFHFIEMNARFWGSLHHALYAGVDFPALLMDIFSGKKKADEISLPEYAQGIQCRYTFPMEVGYVLSLVKDPELSYHKKLYAVIEFFLLFFNRSLFSDLYFPGDRKLYFFSINQMLQTVFRNENH